MSSLLFSKSHHHNDYSRLTGSFEALDEKPVKHTSLYPVLFCCDHAIPEEIAWCEAPKHPEYPAEYLDLGDEAPCPYCGQLSTVMGLSNRLNPPIQKWYSVDGQEPVTLTDIREGNEDLAPEHLEALERLLEGEHTYIGVTPVTRVTAA